MTLRLKDDLRDNRFVRGVVCPPNSVRKCPDETRVIGGTDSVGVEIGVNFSFRIGAPEDPNETT